VAPQLLSAFLSLFYQFSVLQPTGNFESSQAIERENEFSVSLVDVRALGDRFIRVIDVWRALLDHVSARYAQVTHKSVVSVVKRNVSSSCMCVCVLSFVRSFLFAFCILDRFSIRVRVCASYLCRLRTRAGRISRRTRSLSSVRTRAKRKEGESAMINSFLNRSPSQFGS
jgi:hypothetical protein